MHEDWDPERFHKKMRRLRSIDRLLRRLFLVDVVTWSLVVADRLQSSRLWDVCEMAERETGRRPYTLLFADLFEGMPEGIFEVPYPTEEGKSPWSIVPFKGW